MKILCLILYVFIIDYFKWNACSYAFVGVSDSHQMQDLGSLLKGTSSSVDEDGLYC
ncbi:hypothetical protein CNEO3_30071 [Clostridium neonatale]|uniref:hypothetical protein n=1 Tax=Clostridium neonatale TaxID=137838 RepID=UPI00291C012C|nr:hypothetical protein CNEO3_30071 [Clostridium neonatale]